MEYRFLDIYSWLPLFSVFLFSPACAHFIRTRVCLTSVATVTRAVVLSSHFLWLLVVTTVFTQGVLGVNGNLLNYPETVNPYQYNWAPLEGGVCELSPPSKRA